MTKDFYHVHYHYYWNEGQSKGEGVAFLATIPGAGVKMQDINMLSNSIKKGMEEQLKTEISVVLTNFSFLSTCSEDEFNGPSQS